MFLYFKMFRSQSFVWGSYTLIFSQSFLPTNVCCLCRMCKALMPGDEESMSDEAIWETLPVRLYICNYFNFHVLIWFLYRYLMEDILPDCNCCFSQFKILWCLLCFLLVWTWPAIFLICNVKYWSFWSLITLKMLFIHFL
jgi:hypothetical protein